MPVKLVNREFGTGTPFLILHGLFGSSSNWGRIAKILSGSFQVFTLDLRNHGESPHESTMTYEAMAEDILAFMDEKGLEKAILLGHSMGGKTAMVAALNHPSRIEQLIVVDIAPVSYHHDYQQLLNALNSVDFNQIKKRDEVDFHLQCQIPDIGLRHFLMKNLTRKGQQYFWQINLHSIEEAMPALMLFPEFPAERKYSGKTLFIGGANSDYILRQHYQQIFRFFPRNKIVMLKNAGHWVHAEQPQALLKTVQSFINT
ncbi:MAG: alpha/beta fold hydrolase [SAR324 cluster bacterium]|nr:alpha/beta fold hydrolase [SAR324 cluster bacterium]